MGFGYSLQAFNGLIIFLMWPMAMYGSLMCIMFDSLKCMLRALLFHPDKRDMGIAE